jgi:hypothetical protein
VAVPPNLKEGAGRLLRQNLPEPDAAGTSVDATISEWLDVSLFGLVLSPSLLAHQSSNSE